MQEYIPLNLILLATFSIRVLIKLLYEDIAGRRTTFGLALTDQHIQLLGGFPLEYRVIATSELTSSLPTFTAVYSQQNLAQFPFHQNFRSRGLRAVSDLN